MLDASLHSYSTRRTSLLVPLCSLLSLAMACTDGTLGGVLIEPPAHIDAGETRDASGTELGVTMDAASMDAPVDLELADAAAADAVPDTTLPTDAALPTLGCGRAQVSGERVFMTEIRGEVRAFKVYVPDAYDPLRPVPIVMHLHGCSSNYDMAFRNHMRNGVHAAFESEALFVYPQGLAAGGCSAGWDMSSTGKDVEFIDRVLELVQDEFCIDARGIVLTGSSYGGDFTNKYACARPAQVLLGVGQAQSPWDTSDCVGPVAMVLAVATGDAYYDSFTRDGFQASRDFWRSYNGCSSTTMPELPDPCVRYEGCSAHPVIACEIPGGDHDTFPADFGANLLRWYRERRDAL